MDRSLQWEQWVAEYTAPLLAWVRYRLKDPSLAEDLVQETFMAAWESRDKFLESSSPKTWLFGILKRKLADSYRKVYRSKTVGLEEESLEQFCFDAAGEWKKSEVMLGPSIQDENPLDNFEFREALEDCMDKLPPRWNAVIQTQYLGDLPDAPSLQEKWEPMGEAALWQVLRRARLQLRHCLHGQGYQKGDLR